MLRDNEQVSEEQVSADLNSILEELNNSESHPASSQSGLDMQTVGKKLKDVLNSVVSDLIPGIDIPALARRVAFSVAEALTDYSHNGFRCTTIVNVYDHDEPIGPKTTVLYDPASTHFVTEQFGTGNLFFSVTTFVQSSAHEPRHQVFIHPNSNVLQITSPFEEFAESSQVLNIQQQNDIVGAVQLNVVHRPPEMEQVNSVTEFEENKENIAQAVPER